MPHHSWTFDVPAQVIDLHGHVNNVAYVQWMQDAAVRHTKAVSGDIAADSAGVIWVARSHEIEYLRPLFEGDTLRIETWIGDVQRATSERRYTFFCGDREVARGRTKWVCLDKVSGRPRAIPDDVIAAYQEDSK
ncbi:MAG: thioesterase family protein [Rhodothermales bacterium]|nr:thioesterase family protein [Rhodothermales bacterium]MDG2015606.1 thioesterase family protein [Rhodothermales bacterium]